MLTAINIPTAINSLTTFDRIASTFSIQVRIVPDRADPRIRTVAVLACSRNLRE